MTDVRFYAVHVTTQASRERGSSLCWSRPFAVPSEARQYGQAKVRDGDASMAFVVRAEGRERTIIVSSTYPPSARKIIDHYEELLEAVDAYVEE